MHFEKVLDKKRLQILPCFKQLPGSFYLTGGTALALQLGHRISYDFDFFTPDSFNSSHLLEELTNSVFKAFGIKVVQEAENTLDILINEDVKASFLRYRYNLVFPLIKERYLTISNIRDIAATKLVAAGQRATQRDFFDIFFILKQMSLKEIFEISQIKYPNFNSLHYLKSLTYFEDCDSTPPRLIDNQVSFDDVKKRLYKEARNLFDTLSIPPDSKE